MCVQEGEQVGEDIEKNVDNRRVSWPLHCDLLHAQMDNREKDSSFRTPTDQISVANSFPLESICEDTETVDKKQNLMNFVPTLRSGEWSDIGERPSMEDTHICIGDLAKKFGNNELSEEAISFYGVRSWMDSFIIFTLFLPFRNCNYVTILKSLLVANAGDCRAVLSRCGRAVEMSKDHRPLCMKERMRIESVGGYIDDGYLNGQLGVTRALGDWHLEGMKEMNGKHGPLSAEPELKLMTLTKEDEFLIIGSDGIWDVFRSQNAVDFARRRLQEHNDVKQCCREIIGEAIKREATDNLTVVMVCFHSEPPPSVVVERPRVRRSISAEGLQNLKCLLEG
ncbi:hypothetical protein LR48_Vigan01g249900 [Vigna angularis]|uniref:PPM-type phosphatase domain-containing protein n=1 Tax=Phaseolus angularis TaxID=3914 RepID=A0A0L9TQW0_PHAAN|nr:hypothetical protein LR48_Vigan01g249900 [Vigna angularis]